MGATVQNFNTAGSHNVIIDERNSQNGMSDIHVNVDTTLGAVALVLPDILTFGVGAGNIKVTVFDKGGASATNPITIATTPTSKGSKINNLDSIVLNANYGVLEIEVVDDANWGAQLVSASVGVVALPKYASFFQRVTDVAGTIAGDNGKVLFQTAGVNNTSGFASIPASGDISVSSTGIYEIKWGVSGVEPNAFAVFVNNTISVGSIEGSGAGTQQNNGVAQVSLTAGDIVSIKTVNCASAITLALAGTTNPLQNVASISFAKIS